ncbi:MAG: hypothetical protein LPK19_13570, partial [Hymenobacteraceae bacterium]|nr:hypothetical protein [Hymenobacteraceae bacterium]MDX5397254.1 hypothetical protein [Hymenobacteraceae bacterium]MDX5513332.1 hypothetical protein [Hymenobacteraceae bacterium]
MKQKLFLTAMGLFYAVLSFGQNQEKYNQLVKEAWKLYEAKEYKKSGFTYSEAFAGWGNKGVINDRYNAACSYALAGLPDSAFNQLFKIANSGHYTNYNHLTTDSDLKTLHSDKRWPEVTALVKANKAEANFDKPLVAMLDSIYILDQKYRQQMNEVEKKHGWQSEEMQALFRKMRAADSVNVIKVSKVLDERGWPGTDIIGQQGSQTLFLVIQHSDLPVQLKYLPLMREAAKQGKLSAGSLALLEDRVALRQGKKQLYGSQIGRDETTGEHYVLPLADPENVDKRRAEVGLGPLQDYVSNWGITWNV